MPLARIDYATYVSIEHGGHDPLAMTVVKLADVLRVSVDALLGHVDDNERHCSKQEAIGRIIEICRQCDDEFKCPFHNRDDDVCVFWAAGLPVPCDWKE